MTAQYTVHADRLYVTRGVGALFAWLRAGATLIEIVHGDYRPRFHRTPDVDAVWYPPGQATQGSDTEASPHSAGRPRDAVNGRGD